MKYEYGCSECNFHKGSNTKIPYFVSYDCPKCKIGYITGGYAGPVNVPMAFVKKEPKTVGEQARRNTENMGCYEYEDAVHKKNNRVRQASEKMIEKSGGKNFKKSGELPWWRSGKVEGLPKRTKIPTVEEAIKEAKTAGVRVDKSPKLQHR